MCHSASTSTFPRFPTHHQHIRDTLLCCGVLGVYSETVTLKDISASENIAFGNCPHWVGRNAYCALQPLRWHLAILCAFNTFWHVVWNLSVKSMTDAYLPVLSWLFAVQQKPRIDVRRVCVLCCAGAAAERVLQAADQSEGQRGRGQRSRPAG